MTATRASAYGSERPPSRQGLGSHDGLLGGMVISIVIPTLNEERNLGRLLTSIGAQIGVTSEVIVVDQGSSDRTVEIAAQYGCKVLQTERPDFYSPPGRNRNLGAAHAEGAILVHLDADMELASPNLLRRLTSLLNDSHQAAVIHETDVASGFWSKCKAAERECYWNSGLEAARASTKTLFERVGGYHERVSSGEDFYISKRYQLETALVTDPDLVLLHHTGACSLWDLLQKKFRYGMTARTYLRIARDGRLDSWQGIVRRYLQAYVRSWRVAFRDPLHYCGLFPLRVMEFGAVAIGMLIPRRRRPPTR